MRYLHIYFVCAKLFAMDNSANHFQVNAISTLKIMVGFETIIGLENNTSKNLS